MSTTPRNSEILPGKVHWKFEIMLSVAGIALTVLATTMLLQDINLVLERLIVVGRTAQVLEQGVFSLLILVLIYGNFVYQLARLGFYIRDQRHAEHRPTTKQGDAELPEITFLIPSYREQARVVEQALLSAALQEYAHKQIVLLIDDPPRADDLQAQQLLRAAQRLPAQVASFLDGPRKKYERAWSEFEAAVSADDEVDPAAQTQILVALYEDAAQYLRKYADGYELTGPTDALFIEGIVLAQASYFTAGATALRSQPGLSHAELASHYQRLLAVFSAQLSSFERKRYENLSHEKNKAMNLNTYIGLMGGRYREVTREGRLFLEHCQAEQAQLSITDTPYLITLDADSLLMPGYAQRLVQHIEEPGNERLAVVQTPYSAVPGVDNHLERIAGATTDIQLLLHQGYTWAGSTYWVGANALLRKCALEDIKKLSHERGHVVSRYIRDRTVIEDTDSSIDLIDKGWSLYNYPARLAYSATPSDYGALLIQRRRWANGGLLVMPKLLMHLARNFSLKKAGECFVRANYLVSVGLGSLAVLLLIVYPFQHVLRTMWLPLTALPYFYLYGRDLKLSGYKWPDLLRVYALYLLLIPINLGGVLKSLGQALRRKKSTFMRTPKISGRTSAPRLYLFCSALMLVSCLVVFYVDTARGDWLHASFSMANSILFAYTATYLWPAAQKSRNIPLPLETVAEEV